MLYDDLNDVVSAINANIVEALKPCACFANAQVFGIVDTLILKGKNEKQIPAVTAHSGESKPIFPSDCKASGVYHKPTGKTFSVEQKMQRGNCELQTQTCSMQLVAWGFRTKSVNAETFEQLILQALNCNVEITSSTQNRLDVFRSEFSGVEFCLPDNVILIKINYRVKIFVDNCKILNCK